MLELYHSINSVCAQKVRIALKEKGQEAEDHIMTLRGDQYDLGYLELNPNGSCRHWSTTASRSSIPRRSSITSTMLSPSRRSCRSILVCSATACACTTS